MPPRDKLDLYRQLNDSEEVRQWRQEELRREVQKGIDSLERGNFTQHDDSSLESLSRDVKARGRERLRAKNH